MYIISLLQDECSGFVELTVFSHSLWRNCLHFAQVEHLKTLLLSGSSPQLLRSVAGGCVEPDLATALVHGVEEERDELRLRQTELSHALKQLEAENSDLRATVGTLRDALHAAEGQYTWVEEEVKVSRHAHRYNSYRV